MILEGAQPTNPNVFGERLRQLREEAGVSLDTICFETKISRRILQSLEEGSFQHLPERVFRRSFVRQYASQIGADAGPLLDDFEAAWQRFESDSNEFELPLVEEAAPRPSIRWGFWFPISVGALILVSVGIVILSGSEPGQAALVEEPRPIINAAKPEATPARAIAVPSAVPVEEPLLLPNDGVIRIVVRVDRDKECWIHYRDREGRTDQQLLMGGTELSLELEGPVKLTVGNAGAATLVVAGIQYSDLGVPGQVIHTEVSHDGVQALGVSHAGG
jgi:cytoskeletal protein RodZ